MASRTQPRQELLLLSTLLLVAVSCNSCSAGKLAGSSLPMAASTSRRHASAVSRVTARRLQSSRCMCVFDFDNTLRIVVGDNQDTPAPDAAGVINDCKSKGYAIAIASANPDRNKLPKVLQGKVDGSVFNQGFFDSAAFQIGRNDKAISIRNVADYYGARSDCAVLFDDTELNRRYAVRAGAYFAKVNPEHGVSWGDWGEARKHLQQHCGCAA